MRWCTGRYARVKMLLTKTLGLREVIIVGAILYGIYGKTHFALKLYSYTSRKKVGKKNYSYRAYNQCFILFIDDCSFVYLRFSTACMNFVVHDL